ncbi:hypothetical protein FSW04_18490 [Baekduia soli]|uniref:Uncharacterized protein n=1 Tax=Baekduia soli TaxID=496014 RepID=A0A5B8UD98_9ACTN|nr:hypothetical protein FSW04_18490 [Baekduia soli]
MPAPFDLPFVQRAAVELALLAVGSGILGTWIVLRGLSFYAHAVGTAAFPGLVLADGLGFSPCSARWRRPASWPSASPRSPAAGPTPMTRRPRSCSSGRSRSGSSWPATCSTPRAASSDCSSAACWSSAAPTRSSPRSAAWPCSSPPRCWAAVGWPRASTVRAPGRSGRGRRSPTSSCSSSSPARPWRRWTPSARCWPPRCSSCPPRPRACSSTASGAGSWRRSRSSCWRASAASGCRWRSTPRPGPRSRSSAARSSPWPPWRARG